MRCYPACVVIFVFLALGDLLLLVVTNSHVILFPICLRNPFFSTNRISSSTMSSTALSEEAFYYSRETLTMSSASSFRCLTRVTALAVFAVHIFLLVLEMMAVVVGLCSTFWVENMQFREIFRLLRYNSPFWLLHVLLRVGIFFYALCMMSESKDLCRSNSDAVCAPSLSWVFYTGYALLQLADVIMWILNFFFSIFVFGVLSTKKWYAPFTVHCDKTPFSFNAINTRE